jgi:hypothetical protein
MSYVNLNNPANFQLQEFEQLGFRYIVSGRPTIGGETYRTIFVLTDAVVTATCPNGDSLSSETLVAGTVIHGFFEDVSVASGSLLAYKAGPITAQEIFDAYKAYVYAQGGIVEGESCAVADIAALLEDKLYSAASLVLIPSGYKVSHLYAERPLDSNGDFTFTRASSATRVGPDGLIEKAKVAWLLGKGAGGFTNLRQSVTTSGVNTFSVYAKAGTLTELTLRDSATNTYARFNLSDGSLITTNGSPIATSIEDIGGGWYRCSITMSMTSASLQIYPDWNQTTAGNIYIQDAQLEQGLVATDYIETTTTSVSAGILENMPRLDYSGGASCPSLLLEPQRTNLVFYSEDFSNAYWTKQAGITATYNTTETLSPDGTYNATKFVGNGTTGVLKTSISVSGVVSRSVYLKSVTGTTTATFKEPNTNVPSPITLTITNEWQRFEMIGDNGSSFQGLQIDDITSDGIYMWGAQLEVGSYPTSYIPTYGTSATRLVDACSKTGISSLINSPEGVLFVEVAALSNDGTTRQLDLSYGSFNTNYVRLEFASTSNLIYGVVKNTSQQAALSYTLLDSTNLNKIAIKYKANDFALWVNGAEVDTDTSGTAPVNLDSLSFASGTNTNSFYSEIKQLLIFPTALTDAQLAELTTL